MHSGDRPDVWAFAAEDPRVLAQSEPRPYTLSVPRPRRVLTEVHQRWIDAILTADEQAPRKQRHTATHLFRRLRDEEQYVGGYDQVRRYVAAKRGRQRETFLPLSYEPGQRAESDFGQIWVDFPEGREPGSDPARDVGVLECHLYDCAAQREDRGDSARHSGSLCVFSLRAQGAMVG